MAEESFGPALRTRPERVGALQAFSQLPLDHSSNSYYSAIDEPESRPPPRRFSPRRPVRLGAHRLRPEAAGDRQGPPPHRPFPEYHPRAGGDRQPVEPRKEG